MWIEQHVMKSEAAPRSSKMPPRLPSTLPAPPQPHGYGGLSLIPAETDADRQHSLAGRENEINEQTCPSSPTNLKEQLPAPPPAASEQSQTPAGKEQTGTAPSRVQMGLGMSAKEAGTQGKQSLPLSRTPSTTILDSANEIGTILLKLNEIGTKIQEDLREELRSLSAAVREEVRDELGSLTDRLCDSVRHELMKTESTTIATPTRPFPMPLMQGQPSPETMPNTGGEGVDTTHPQSYVKVPMDMSPLLPLATMAMSVPEQPITDSVMNAMGCVAAIPTTPQAEPSPKSDLSILQRSSLRSGEFTSLRKSCEMKKSLSQMPSEPQEAFMEALAEKEAPAAALEDASAQCESSEEDEDDGGFDLQGKDTDKKRNATSVRAQSEFGGDVNIHRFDLSRERRRRHSSPDTKDWRDMTAADVLNSTKFDNLIGSVILLNAVTIGIGCDHSARNETEEVPPMLEVFEYFFLVVFACELSLRLYVSRAKFFFGACGSTLLWNWFDTLVVAAQLFEEIMKLFTTLSSPDGGPDDQANVGMGQDLSIMRTMRILRLMRILRVMRVLRLISELRTIVSSIAGSMKSLCWVVMLLALMMYIVGIYFTQSMTAYFVEKNLANEIYEPRDETLRRYFSSLGRTILSLFQAISGGADWDEMAAPLLDVGLIHCVLFTSYIAFAILALLNVVTGVFVQTALQSARDEEDNFITDQIMALFKSGEQTLRWEDVEFALTDSGAAAEWKTIDVSPEEAKHLFELLDLNNEGVIDFEEFLGGCLRIHGPAKAWDLLMVMQEHRAFCRNTDAKLRIIGEVLDSMENVQNNGRPIDKCILAHIARLEGILHYLMADVHQALTYRKLSL